MGFTEFKIKVFPVPLNEETVPAIEVSGECPERLQAEENTSKNMSTLRRKMQQYSRIKWKREETDSFIWREYNNIKKDAFNQHKEWASKKQSQNFIT